MPRVFIQFLCSVEQEVKLSGKSGPQMWPAIDHTHLRSGLVSKVWMKAVFSRPTVLVTCWTTGLFRVYKGTYKWYSVVSPLGECPRHKDAGNSTKWNETVWWGMWHAIFFQWCKLSRGVAITAWLGLVFSFILKKPSRPTITHTRLAESHWPCLPVQEHSTDSSGVPWFCPFVIKPNPLGSLCASSLPEGP